jgi:hypothetical protein
MQAGKLGKKMVRQDAPTPKNGKVKPAETQ